MILVAKVDFIDTKDSNKRYNLGDRFECLCDETAKRFIDADVVDEVKKEIDDTENKSETETEEKEETKEEVKEVKPKGRPKNK